MSRYGHVLKIFVMPGDFEGFQAIELANWSGKAFLGQRNHASLCSKRPELNKSGFYILVSQDQNEDGVFQIYVGESDAFSARISSHVQTKKWWDKFIVFTTGDDNLTKAHVRYLEREIYHLVQASGAPVEIMNTSTPGGANLSEAEISFASSYLNNVLFVLKTLGFDYFSSTVEKPVNEIKESTIEGERFYILLPKYYWTRGKPIKGFMYVENDLFIVEKGSYFRLEPTLSFEKQNYYKIWLEIVNSNKVSKSDIPGLGILNEDVTFTSASASGAVIRGKATNGLTKWISCKNEKTIKEYI